MTIFARLRAAGRRQRAVMVAIAVGLAGCGDDGSGSTSEGTGSGTSMTGDPSTTQAPTGVDSSGTFGGTDGALPPNCGWNGDAYACGFMGVDPAGTPIACDAMPGQLCQSGDPSCCLPDGDALVCDCDGQACDYVWTPRNCAIPPPPGPCGWWDEGQAYACGGVDPPPAEFPMACETDPVEGEECTGSQCCDPAGDLWTCVIGENGLPSVWTSTDC